MSLKINTTLGSESIQISGQDVLTFRYNSYVPTRQTVLAAAVDSSGFTALGGSTGSTTLTTTAISVSVPFVVTAANSFNLQGAVNVMGMSTSNLTWTGLSTNGTMYLYVDIGSDGTVTTGSGTLAPVYQFGGTYSTTSGQFTFNIQEMVGKVGNGSSAVQTHRVYVGEVTVSGNVVAAIVWYALMRRYEIESSALAINTTYVHNHNLGTDKCKVLHLMANATYGWSASRVYYNGAWYGSVYGNITSKTVTFRAISELSFMEPVTGTSVTATKYKIIVNTEW